jgi:acyl dehydratase
MSAAAVTLTEGVAALHQAIVGDRCGSRSSATARAPAPASLRCASARPTRPGASCSTTAALPDVASVLAWHSCDHPGPVYAGDVLRSAIAVERAARWRRGAARERACRC